MMKTGSIRDWMEQYQVIIYFIAVLLGGISAAIFGTIGLEKTINPALALMLYVTFLQVPVTELGAAFQRGRFIVALLLTNFLVIPFLVVLLVQFLPPHPLLLLGVLLVLLTPCIDYVVTFSQLGRADSRLLLAATPLLLIIQILLLPVYLRLFIGRDASALIHPAPFIEAFVWLIAVPLCAAAATQLLARRSARLAAVSRGLGILPVPATALVLYIVVAGMLPQLGAAWPLALQVIPVYIAFALLAPLCGWGVAQLFGLQASAARAIAFSGATRNALVILPLALAVPGAIPVLPAVIVAQTMVELLSELLYIRLIPKLGHTRR